MKSPKIEKILDQIAQETFGRTRSESLKFNKCIMCGNQAEYFKDAISQREYFISGLCQECQDKIYKEDVNDGS